MEFCASCLALFRKAAFCMHCVCLSIRLSCNLRMNAVTEISITNCAKCAISDYGWPDSFQSWWKYRSVSVVLAESQTFWNVRIRPVMHHTGQPCFPVTQPTCQNIEKTRTPTRENHLLASFYHPPPPLDPEGMGAAPLRLPYLTLPSWWALNSRMRFDPVRIAALPHRCKNWKTCKNVTRI